MKKRVRVTYLPKAVVGMQVTGKINNKDGSVVTGGYAPLSGGQGTPGVEVNRTIKPTTRENATLEAEKGETVITNLTQGGIPEFYTIGGKRHSQGGTPLNLPADSFIFSRDRKMKIKDKEVLAQFGKGGQNGRKGFTPAELSKKFDLNPFRKILADPSSDHFQIKTAEMMIQNYNLKLGGLALAQESIKGFPNGIPGVAMPYLENVGIDPATLIPQQEQQQQMPQARYGMNVPGYNYGGMPMAQTGLNFTGATTETGRGVNADIVQSWSKYQMAPDTRTNKQKLENPMINYQDEAKMSPAFTPAVWDKEKMYDLVNDPNYDSGQGVGGTNDYEQGIVNYYNSQFKVGDTEETGKQYFADQWADTQREYSYTADASGEGSKWGFDQEKTDKRKAKEDLEGYKAKGWSPKFRQVTEKGFSKPRTQRWQPATDNVTGEFGSWAYSTPAEIKHYATKFGDEGGLSGRELTAAINDDPVGFVNSFNQAKDATLAALDLKRITKDKTFAVGGGVPEYQFEGEVSANNESFTEDDYTTPYQDAQQEQLPIEAEYTTNTPESGQMIRMNAEGAYEVVDTEGNVIGKVSVPKTSSQSTRSQNIPKNAVKWDMSTEGYKENEVQAGDYVKQTNGKWYKVTGYKQGATAYTGSQDDLDPILKGKMGDFGENYGRIKQRIEGNADLKKAIIDQYRIKMDQAKPGKNLTALDIEKAKALTPTQIMSNFYRAQKQNMAVAAQKGAIDANADVWDKDRSHYINTVTELGLTPMETWETAAFQGTYNGLVDISKNPQYKELLEDFQLRPVGKKDEPMGRISNIDGWYGNTTIGEMAKYKPIDKQLQMQEAAWKDNPQVNHMKEQMQGMKTPFWTEDIVNLGFGLKNLTDIKRYRPWNAMPGTKLPHATFMTPDQQIQNILGATNVGAQGAAAFGSPQGYMANFAGLHGNAMNQVAKAIGNVQDKNVQIANRSEVMRSQIMNQANSKRGQLATNLHDKNTIMNQQYDNSKRQAWDAIRRNLNSAWTNRGMTQNMNTFNDQYYIDPQTGYKHFYNPREVRAKNSQSKGLYDQASIYKSDNPDMQWRDAIALARSNKGLPPQSATGFSGVDPNTMAPGYPGAANTGYYPQEG